MERWTVDRFSYLPEKENSFLELENVFYQAMNGIIGIVYKVLFTQEDLNIILCKYQLVMIYKVKVNRLIILYVKNKIIAIIGYRN